MKLLDTQKNTPTKELPKGVLERLCVNLATEILSLWELGSDPNKESICGYGEVRFKEALQKSNTNI